MIAMETPVEMGLPVKILFLTSTATVCQVLWENPVRLMLTTVLACLVTMAARALIMRMDFLAPVSLAIQEVCVKLTITSVAAVRAGMEESALME